MLKLAVWLGGIVDFEKVEEILERVGQISISDSSVWRRTQAWGESFRSIAETERIRANVLPGMWGGPCQTVEPKGRMGVSMDGAKIHIRDEGWKELKVGSIFEVQVRPTLDPQTGDRIELAHAVNNSYVAHLGGPEIFGQMVWAEAQRRGWEGAADTEAVGDAAPWIWNLTADYFYDSHQVVAEFVDNSVSGNLPMAKRPQGHDMLDALERREGLAIVVTTADRLSRDFAHWRELVQQWQQAGIELHYVRGM